MADEDQNVTAPADVPARLDRADGLSFAITTLIALTVYLFTLAPEVTFSFSGVLITAAQYQGIGPPPGYPAWTLYSWFFIKLLPFSNPAWRVAAGSAVAGSVACGLVALIVSHNGRLSFVGLPAFERFSQRERMVIRIFCGSVAGLALAFSGRFWFEAVIPDFWTFSVLMFVIVLYFLSRWITTSRRCFCWFAFFAYGLLLTDNQELMIGLPGLALAVMLIDPKLGRDVSFCVLPLGAAISLVTGFPLLAGPWWSRPMLESFAVASLAALAVIVATRRIGSEWKSALACTVFLCLGLAVYFYVPIASMTNPPMNWGYPRTAEGFFHVISRGQYELVNPTSDLPRFKMQLWALLNNTGREFDWFYLVFTALPFCLPWRMTPLGRKWVLSLLPILLCVGPLLIALGNPQMGSDFIFEPYFFPLRVLLALWTGLGLILFATITSSSGPMKRAARETTR